MNSHVKGNDAGETLSFHASELTLPRHESIHRELEVYAELMHWMKAMDRKAYIALMRVYTGAISKLYDRDIKQFFEEAKLRISGQRVDKRGTHNFCAVFYFCKISVLTVFFF